MIRTKQKELKSYKKNPKKYRKRYELKVKEIRRYIDSIRLSRKRKENIKRIYKKLIKRYGYNIGSSIPKHWVRHKDDNPYWNLECGS